RNRGDSRRRRSRTPGLPHRDTAGDRPRHASHLRAAQSVDLSVGALTRRRRAHTSPTMHASAPCRRGTVLRRQATHSVSESSSCILLPHMTPDDPSMPMTDSANRNPWHWWLLLSCVGLFAFGVRYYYVTHAQVFQPVNQANVRGDAVEYYNYAANLAAHDVFSKARPSTFPLIGDSFRDPGYPFFLAGWMKVFPQW